MSVAEHKDAEHRDTDSSAPAVSIITPTYNHAAYIEACIASVQAQGRPDWEMLVIDDGSTDGTAGLAESMAAADPRIRLFRQKNRGILRLHETYNFALAQARGRYVAVLEGDDLWLPNKLAVQLAGLEADPEAVLAWSDAVFFGDASGDIGQALPASIERRDDRFRNEPVGRVLDQLYLHNCIAAVTVVIKTEVLREMGGFRQTHGLPLVDLPTWLDLACRGRFVFHPEPLAKWRWHASQVTKSMHLEIIEGCRQLVLEHHGALSSEVREHVSVTTEAIEAAFAFKRHEALAQTGRYRLVQKRFGEAREAYRKALLFTGPFHPALRLQAVAGLVASLLGRDLEGLARRLGKNPIT